MALLPKFSGFISMTFSSLILYSILGVKILQQNNSNKHKQQHDGGGGGGSTSTTNATYTKKPPQVYDRLIMGMSIADLLGSFWMFMSTWPIPESTGALWAVGNQATCNLQGFFTQGFTIASAIYNASLTFYFLVVVIKQWKKPILEKYEWCFHILPWTWGISTGIAGIPLKLYNNANLWCFIAEAPNDPERGQDANFFRMLFFYGPLYLMISIVSINVILIVLYVRRVTTKAMNNASTIARKGGERRKSNNTDDDDMEVEEEEEDYDGEFMLMMKSSAAAAAADGNKTVTGRTSSDMFSIPSQQQQQNQSSTVITDSASRNRITKWRQKVARQNLRYAFAFYWTWLPISTVRMLQIVGHKVPFWLIVIACITTPMQGLPQCFVYFYPKYVNYQKHNKNTRPSIWKWIQAGLPTTTQSNKSSSRGRRRRGDHHGGGDDKEIGGGAGDPTTKKKKKSGNNNNNNTKASSNKPIPFNNALPASRVTVDSWNALDPMSSVTCSGALLDSDVEQNYYNMGNPSTSNKVASGCSLLVPISEEEGTNATTSDGRHQQKVGSVGSTTITTTTDHQQQQKTTIIEEQPAKAGTTSSTKTRVGTNNNGGECHDNNNIMMTNDEMEEDVPVVNVEGDFEDEVARWYG